MYWGTDPSIARIPLQRFIVGTLQGKNRPHPNPGENSSTAFPIYHVQSMYIYNSYVSTFVYTSLKRSVKLGAKDCGESIIYKFIHGTE